VQLVGQEGLRRSFVNGGYSRSSCCKPERAGHDAMIVKQIWTANAYRNFRQYT
jgi:hypothetical protein